MPATVFFVNFYVKLERIDFKYLVFNLIFLGVFNWIFHFCNIIKPLHSSIYFWYILPITRLITISNFRIEPKTSNWPVAYLVVYL